MSDIHDYTQKSTHKIQTRIRLFFRYYPLIIYVLKWLFLALLLGFFIGTASALFLETLNRVTAFRDTHLWIIFLLPLSGFLIGLVYLHLGKNVEAGNDLIIDTIHDPKKIIPLSMAPLVYIGTLGTHLFGGSAGREGTAIQMAGSIADQFSKPFRLSVRERKVLIIASIAAGFGSVFGVPIAGAIFGLEVFLIGRMKYDAIFPAFLFSIIADLVTKAWNVHHTIYPSILVPEISIADVIFVIIAGIIFGLCAAVFSKLVHLIKDFFTAKIKYPPLRPLLGGIIMVCAVGMLDTTKYIGLGISTIEGSFHEHLPAYDFGLKSMLTILTLSSGFKGGEVTPLFFIGATLGNALSYFIPLPLGLLSGLGFVAVFAGAANTPIACGIMAIELFGVECGVYATIACVVSYLFSGRNGIYTRQMVGEAKHDRFNRDKGKRLNEL